MTDETKIIPIPNEFELGLFSYTDQNGCLHVDLTALAVHVGAPITTETITVLSRIVQTIIRRTDPDVEIHFSKEARITDQARLLDQKLKRNFPNPKKKR